MGVVYKLNPEVIKYIIQEKKADSLLSCRKIVSLVENKFQVKISKSSINSLIKEKGLSMPVGRRCNPKKNKKEALELGVVFLKAADYLVGGSKYIGRLLQRNFPSAVTQPQNYTEYLLYSSVFNKFCPGSFLYNSGPVLFSGLDISDGGLNSLSAGIKQVEASPEDTEEVILNGFQPISGINLSLSDGRVFYFDGQMHTVWPSAKIPHFFATVPHEINDRVKKSFQGDSPFIFFMSPGYNTPLKEFFDFLFVLDSDKGDFSKLSFNGSKSGKLDEVFLKKVKKNYFIFGLWPWQFTEYREIRVLGEFRHMDLSSVREDFCIADAEINLSRPGGDNVFKLRGTALKAANSDEVKLFIASNFPAAKAGSEDLARMYFDRWPNLEEAFRDFSKKVQLSTGENVPEYPLLSGNIKVEKDKAVSIEILFDYYLKALDQYSRNYFFPGEYKDKDLETVKSRFYNLKGIFKKQKGDVLINFKPPSGYPFLKDLEYACRRVNERGVIIGDKKRLWCLVTEQM